MSLPTAYQQFIHMSRYSRWRDDLGRRETWEETVSRYVDFMAEHLKSKHGVDIIATGDYTKAYNAIHDLKVMPSMRALMTAGPALARDAVTGYNCLAGDTLFVTKEMGAVALKDAVGPVTVLNSEKKWVPAEVKSFGAQSLYEVIWGYNRHNQTVRATLDHDWVLADGRRVKTRDLKAGDRVAFTSASRHVGINDEEYKFGLIHGTVYGDGTGIYQQKRHYGYHIRLCGSSKELLNTVFAGCKHSFPPTFNGDPVVYFFDPIGKTIPMKELPPQDSSDSYLIGFFRGWLAADGSVAKNGQVTLCCGEEEYAWAVRNLAKVGYVFGSWRPLPSRTNFGERKKAAGTVGIKRQSLTEDDIILSEKRRNFTPVTDAWTFRGIDYTKEYVEEVYCAVVPGTHDFALANGLLTGNCAYLEIDDPRAFDEILVILMSGTGVGFSVEQRCVDKLPVVSEHFEKSSTVLVVEDSKSGWGRALRELISLLYAGQIPFWDLSKLRPAGARLKIMGGRSSGPEPLNDLFKFAVQTFQNAKGRRLTTLECHDLVCKIASIVVVGGVRRSALISLSDLSDTRLQGAKSGQWYITHPYRALANNSAVHNDSVPLELFMDEWKALYTSGSGERGIFSRDAAVSLMEGNEYRDPNRAWGTNPCAEIILRPMEFCNLTSVSVRPEDSEDDLAEKVRIASMIGTWQSTLTHFKYLRKKWKDNCEEERLLGVSLNGVFNNPTTYASADSLRYLKGQARLENAKWAALLNIHVSAAITCVKPEGTTSQLNNVPSGLHPAYAPFYIRRVRQDNKDPVTQFLKDQGIPSEPCVMNPKDVTVFSFPIATGCSVTGIDAISHLEIWKRNQLNWCEHKPSVTVTVKQSEWLDVAAWVWKNRNIMSGVSFLPDPTEGGVVYQQMPYEKITQEEYERLNSTMPKTLDWTKLSEYEKYDTTTSAREFACVGNTCEVIGTDA